MPTYPIQCKKCDCLFQYTPQELPVYHFEVQPSFSDDSINLHLFKTSEERAPEYLEFSLLFKSPRDPSYEHYETFKFPTNSDKRSKKKSTFYLTCPCNGHTEPYELNIKIN